MRRAIALTCALIFAALSGAAALPIPHAPYAEADWTQAIEPFRIAGNI